MDHYAEMRLAIGKEISEKEAALKAASDLRSRNKGVEFAHAKTVHWCDRCIQIGKRLLETQKEY